MPNFKGQLSEEQVMQGDRLRQVTFTQHYPRHSRAAADARG